MEISQDSPKPKAVLFDAYGTLFDVYSVGSLAEQLFPGRGQALSLLWRDKQIEYTRLVTTSNDGAHYQPFLDLTRAALRYAGKRLVLDLTSEHEGQLMNQYRHLSSFPENRDVLAALKARASELQTWVAVHADDSLAWSALAPDRLVLRRVAGRRAL